MTRRVSVRQLLDGAPPESIDADGPGVPVERTAPPDGLGEPAGAPLTELGDGCPEPVPAGAPDPDGPRRVAVDAGSVEGVAGRYCPDGLRDVVGSGRIRK